MNSHTIRELRSKGEHERARELAVKLVAADPRDAEIQFEAACVHDFLGYEIEAVPYYKAAIAGRLPAQMLRSAYLGLGSTYRALGRYVEAEATLREGLQRFPAANEIKVFLAMTEHNRGRSKQAVQALLRLLAETSADEAIRSYKQAISLYAEDIDKSWEKPRGRSQSS